ncbi:MAG: excalibur calcium-binding domain-containing protein [Novosphingobium sp.]|nr:excalibur calcium-binding domain-containing protein [Novosphingobium sp.]
MRYIRSTGDIALKDDRASKGVIALAALAFVALGFGAAQTSIAHPGGLNAEGCHNNRKTGDYHCHRPATRSAPRQLASSPVPGGSYYPNCASARAAGVAPLRRGDPGYRAGLDRDGDGIACE